MSKNKNIYAVLEREAQVYDQIQSRQHSVRVGKLKAFLDQHKRASQWAVSVAALEDALSSGVKPSNDMICETITKCGMKGKLSAAKKLYTSFYKKLGRPRPLAAHIAFMGACAACGDFVEAHHQLTALVERDKAMIAKNSSHRPIVNDDLMTQYLKAALSCAIKSSNVTGNANTGAKSGVEPQNEQQIGAISSWQIALENFLSLRKENENFRNHLDLTPLLIENAVQLAEYGSQWRLCLQIINSAHSQQSVVPPEAYDAAVRACFKGKKHVEVVSLLNELIATKTPPDERSVRLGLLSAEEVAAAEKAEQVDSPTSWALSLTLFKAMKQNGLVLYQQSYEAPLRACALAGKWEECLEMVNIMKQDGRPVSSSLYGCVIASRVENASSFSEMERFLELSTVRDGEANIVVYLGALRGCMRLRDWKNFDKINREMKDKEMPETFEKILILLEAAYLREKYHAVLMRFARFQSITNYEKGRVEKWGTVRLYEEDFDVPERLLDMVIDAFSKIESRPSEEDAHLVAAYQSAVRLKEEKQRGTGYVRLPASFHNKEYAEAPPWMYSQEMRKSRTPGDYQ